MTENLDEALELFHSLPKYDVKPGLARIKYLLDGLGNPDRNYRSIHIAGSNGKGSVAAMLSGVTSQSHRVGEFLSPPLRRFSDRIVVDCTPIDKSSIIEGAGKIAEPIRKLRRKGNEPSFFEAVTALAAWYFDREEVDLALLEAGLGGRYDATNPVGKPVLSVVTSVDLEHQKILGDSIEEIARELAGIANRNKPLVIGPSQNIPDRIFREECQNRKCKLVRAEEETKTKIRDFDWTSSRFELEKSPVEGLEEETLEIGLAGTYQERNLRTSLTILGELHETEFSPRNSQIITGLKNASWPGRFQLLEKNPHLLVDGAHNEAAAGVLREELERYFPLRPKGAKIRLVFSALKDKDIKGMMVVLQSVVDEIFLTELDLPRAAPLKALERWADQIGLDYRGIELPLKAIEIAKSESNTEDLICITGSLYLVREAIGSES